MALRDQPYLPLYIQDIMTDEKLNECCAATHGVYIKGIMCLMHKSEEYGKILLKQKDQQTDNKVKNFALKIARHTPYSEEEIEAALFELLAEKVLYIDGDSLCQKRMIEDNHISQVRSKAGKTSADTKEKKRKKKKDFVPTNQSTNDSTKTSTNSENEIEVENEDETVVVEFKEGEVPRGTVDVMIDKICKYFSVTCDVMSPLYDSVSDFVETVAHRGEMPTLTTALEKYQAYKARSQETIHGVGTWIGTRDRHYRDGQWIMTNWEEKDKNYKQPTKENVRSANQRNTESISARPEGFGSFG